MSANRDTTIHEDPHVFDITRKSARKHLTFGNGVHMCNGNQLGKIQIKKVIQALLLDENIKNIRLANFEQGNLTWVHTYTHLETLDLIIDV